MGGNVNNRFLVEFRGVSIPHPASWGRRRSEDPAKQAIHQGVALEVADGLAVEQRCFERTMRSKDAAGAMRAWLNGETWTWKGE